ncbi:hypothetical protein JG687_00004528 [Phytophthora cactorum]|uniref:Uncharacterized protein n=1 Tax=Phytophthora cactorum TaxID=29920 RepID=A0A8T1UPL5_9STRA|nr:hypothetical protein PC120_g15785 [Phytophthora cactorum]KAG4048752.1 hypothetical protein PC123_g15939 [Phytophthora cactorum]KAG6966986.1 hypothetical protein JG687_00004528 [Phytophthora cactorum]
MTDLLDDVEDSCASGQVGERGIRMADLINPATRKGEAEEAGVAEVRDVEAAPGRDNASVSAPEVATRDPRLTQEEQEEIETDGVVTPGASPKDTFELDSERFAEEQARTPWMRAMKAFLEAGALALDP